jgi:hypothetical protein
MALGGGLARRVLLSAARKAGLGAAGAGAGLGAGLGALPAVDPGTGSGCGDPAAGTTDPSSALKYSWLIAVFLCIISAFSINFGVNLQKVAWNRRRVAKERAAEAEEEGEDGGSVDALEHGGGGGGGEPGGARRGSGGLSGSPLGSSSSVSSSSDGGAAAPSGGAAAGRRSHAASLVSLTAKPSDESRFRRLWSMGFACIVVGSVFDFAALAFGAQSIVAPLGSISLVANIMFAQVMHGEKLSRTDLVATCVIILGCIVSVAFASHKNEICDIDTLLGLYAKPRFAIYASCILLLLTGGVLAVRHMEHVVKVYGTRSARYQAVFQYHRFSYAFLSGVAGAQSVLFAKSLDELLVSSFSGDSKIFLAHFGSYLIALSMFCSVGLQVYWLNCALARWDALYVVPVFQAQWIVFSVIGGGVFYGEFAGFSFGQAVAFMVGVALTVLGVYFLSQRDAGGHGGAETFGEQQQGGSAALSAALDQVPALGAGAGGDSMSAAAAATLDSSDSELAPRVAARLDTPLLASPPGGRTGQHQHRRYNSGASGRMLLQQHAPPQEYDVTFTARTVGLSVEPCTIETRRSSFRAATASALPPAIKLWRVRATKHGPGHPVKVGHCIVAVNGDSVVGHDVKLQHVLDLVSNGQRPLTVRFRTEPTAEQPAALALAPAPVPDAAGSTVSSLSSEAASAAQLVFDDDQADVDALEALPSSLQGVPLNPLLGIVHSAWTTPGTYDRLAREQDDAVDLAHARTRSQRGVGLQEQQSFSHLDEGVQNRKSRGTSSASAPVPAAAATAPAPAAPPNTSAHQSAARAPAHEDEPRDPLTRP